MRTETSIEEKGDDKQQPEGFQLYSNYPNPFNGGTRIRFELISASRAVLRIVSVSGNVLLEQTFYQAGVHEIEWNGQNNAGESLPSGVYLISLQSENSVAKIKATLVR